MTQPKARFFLVARGVLDRPPFQNSAERTIAWLRLIEQAASEPTTVNVSGRMVVVGVGQVSTSLRILARQWAWSQAKVIRFLARLEAEAMLSTATEAGRLLLTVCNYEQYQGPSTPSGAVGGAEPEQDPSGAGTRKAKTKAGNEWSGTEAEGCRLPSACKTASQHTLASLTLRRADGGDLVEAVRSWNLMAFRASLAQVKDLSPTRKRLLAARLKDVGGIEGWAAFLQQVSGSSFLLGSGGRGWSVTFDWILKPANFQKVREGNYGQTKQPPDTRRDAWDLITGSSKAEAGAGPIVDMPHEGTFS